MLNPCLSRHFLYLSCMWEIKSLVFLVPKGSSKYSSMHWSHRITWLGGSSSSTLCPLPPVCRCLQSSGDSPSFSRCWLRDFCWSKTSHDKITHFLSPSDVECDTKRNAGYYFAPQSGRIEFHCVWPPWQEEVLQASPADSVYNDPWGVHSRKVSFYCFQVSWLLHTPGLPSLQSAPLSWYMLTKELFWPLRAPPLIYSKRSKAEIRHGKRKKDCLIYMPFFCLFYV